MSIGNGDDTPPQRGIRILSLDGGGIRGLIEIEILSIISQVIFNDPTGIELIQCFDMICGTSTGGILSIALASGITLQDANDLYMKFGVEIFSKPLGAFGRRSLRYFWNGDYYSSSQLEELVQKYLGNKKLSSVSESQKVFVVSTNATQESWRPYLFRNFVGIPTSGSPGSSQATVVEAVRATSAAPTFFKPEIIGERTFVDGGAIANNPTELAIFEAKSIWPNRPIECILSLGCGKPKPSPGSQNLFRLFEEIIDISTCAQMIHEKVKHWLSLTMPETNYLRFDPNHGEGSIRLDESDPEILNHMMATTAQYMSTETKKIEKLREILQPKSENYVGDSFESSFHEFEMEKFLNKEEDLNVNFIANSIEDERRKSTSTINTTSTTNTMEITNPMNFMTDEILQFELEDLDIM